MSVELQSIKFKAALISKLNAMDDNADDNQSPDDAIESLAEFISDEVKKMVKAAVITGLVTGVTGAGIPVTGSITQVQIS